MQNFEIFPNFCEQQDYIVIIKYFSYSFNKILTLIAKKLGALFLLLNKILVSISKLHDFFKLMQ
jgi:hypothetical protein